jgi:hypothetical protein
LPALITTPYWYHEHHWYFKILASSIFVNPGLTLKRRHGKAALCHPWLSPASRFCLHHPAATGLEERSYFSPNPLAVWRCSLPLCSDGELLAAMRLLFHQQSVVLPQTNKFLLRLALPLLLAIKITTRYSWYYLQAPSRMILPTNSLGFSLNLQYLEYTVVILWIRIPWISKLISNINHSKKKV